MAITVCKFSIMRFKLKKKTVRVPVKPSKIICFLTHLGGMILKPRLGHTHMCGKIHNNRVFQ